MNALSNIPVITEHNDLAGKKVLLRVDFNVTLDDEGKVMDDYRIKKARPTIDYLRERGAYVIIASHLEHNNEVVSLKSVSEYFQDEVSHVFVEKYDDVEDALGKTGVVLLENLRFHEEEEANDDAFARRLAGIADLFVFDAFAVSHREHASVVGVTKYLPSYLGLLMVDEIENLSRAFAPDHPFVFILGGAKFQTKLPLVEKFLSKADTVFIGGALANDILKIQGKEIGKSIVSEGDFDLQSVSNNEKVLIPRDVIVENSLGEKVGKDIEDVNKEDTIWDLGERSLDILGEKIKEAKFILWNGPVGNYEIGYKEGTEGVARMLSKSKADVVVGGGDTLTAIESLDVMDRFSFVSTGGGAMLEFLAKEDLPALKALRKTR